MKLRNTLLALWVVASVTVACRSTRDLPVVHPTARPHPKPAVVEPVPAQVVEPARPATTPIKRTLKTILSDLQELSQGAVSAAEWDRAMGELQALIREADQAANWDDAVHANVIVAMMYADIRRDHQMALNILHDTMKKYDKYAPATMPEVYVRQAQSYSALGDQAAVQRTMDEFRTSKYHKAETPDYQLLDGRNTAMVVPRPAQQGPDTTIETAIKVASIQAKHAVGSLCPDFNVVDSQGRKHGLRDYRGKVVLLDFWVPEWSVWIRDLPLLKEFASHHEKEGFVVLGISLRAGDDMVDYARGKGIRWPIVTNERDFPRQLGIYGSATTVLIDRAGQIIGWNLHGSELTTRAANALEE